MRLCVPLRFADAGFQLALASCCVGVVVSAGNCASSEEVTVCSVGWGSKAEGDSDRHVLGMLSLSAQRRPRFGVSIGGEGARAESGPSPENELPISGEVDVGLTFTDADH